MEAVYLDILLSAEQIHSTLSRLFPDLEFFYWNIENGLPAGLDDSIPHQILFHIDSYLDRKELKYEISIFGNPDENANEREIVIGKALSDDHNVRVLVGFTDPQDPDNPFYDLVFHKGKVWLADDCNTSFADGTEGLIKIVREYRLPLFKFDSQGHLT